jgi:intracellular multiplication protein IcmK
MNKGKKMQKKIFYTTISSIISLFLVNNAFSQEIKTTTATLKTEANVGISNTPNTPNTNINYNPGAANLNGDKIPIPPNNQRSSGENLPNNLPNQAPVGLPSDAGSGYSVNKNINRNQIDPIEATINILNTPDQKIREINKDIYKKGKVISETPIIAPKISNDVIVARLDPGSISPVIRVGKNRTTTITITDMTGQPWPIINYDGLSDEDFIVKRLDNPSPDGYVLSITPKGQFVSGNLVLVLKGLPTPISIDFVSNQKVIDGTKQIRVMGRGPNTQLTSIALPDSLDTTLLSILQGVAPEGFTMLKTSTAAVQAWKSKEGSMYVRTRYKIMSPAFEHVTSSPDGTYAYKMVPVSVVLYKADEGRFGEFKVEGF